ncbi:MAG: hypothetical protein AVO38_00105 [delta proteobacterium ML8_D]|nr:MAG: hypothetical protein AVO38_00105 [delta proteobacterium ML8_D]
MNKKDFINILSSNLRGVPEEDRKDAISDFEEHFKEGLLEGRAEEDIAISLGDPKVLAGQLKATILVDKAEKATSAINITRAVFATMGLGFFNLIFILGPFIAVVAVLLALFVSAIAITASGITLFLAAIFGPLFPQYFTVLVTPAVAVFISIGLTCFGILFFIGNIYLAKWLYRLFIRYIKFNLRIITGRER